MTITMRELTTHADLLGASDHDPFVRWDVDPGAPIRAWALDEGVAFMRTSHSGRRQLTVVSSPAHAARVLRAHLDQLPVDPVSRQAISVPQGTLDLLGPDPRVGPGADWEWMWTDDAPAAHPAGARVHPIGEDDLDDVRALLAEASPRHSTDPGDPDVVQWLGVRDRGGRLVACGAHTEHVPGVPHLASIATHPSARGQGLGEAVTSELSRRAMAGAASVVTLGMYSDNVVARRLYERLGLRCAHRWSSRAVRRQP